MAPRVKREIGSLVFYRTEVSIRVMGNLYASSPTTPQGISAMLKANQPSESQLEDRRALGEEITPNDVLTRHIESETVDQIPEVTRTLEGGKSPSTVFRRGPDGRPFVHSNYFKGHLRECGETVGRIVNIWGLKDLVTRTVMVCPDKVYLDGDIRCLQTFFTPEVRTARGITVKMPTEKISEYVENPTLNWVLYIAGDLRWNEPIFEAMLSFGGMRGLGPGRGTDESKYSFKMGPWSKLNYREAQENYAREFASPCVAHCSSSANWESVGQALSRNS